MERLIGLIMREGAQAAFEEAKAIFPDIKFCGKANSSDLIRPETSLWKCDCINGVGRMDHQDTLCSYELMFGKRPLCAPLPFLMLGYHQDQLTSKTQAEGYPCFYLNSGFAHSRNFYKVLYRSRSTGADLRRGLRILPEAALRRRHSNLWRGGAGATHSCGRCQGPRRFPG